MRGAGTTDSDLGGLVHELAALAALDLSGLVGKAAQTAALAAEVKRLRAARPLEWHSLQGLWIDSLIPQHSEPNTRLRFVTDTDHLDDRLDVAGSHAIPPLGQLVRARAQTA